MKSPCRGCPFEFENKKEHETCLECIDIGIPAAFDKALCAKTGYRPPIKSTYIPPAKPEDIMTEEEKERLYFEFCRQTGFGPRVHEQRVKS